MVIDHGLVTPSGGMWATIDDVHPGGGGCYYHQRQMQSLCICKLHNGWEMKESANVTNGYLYEHCVSEARVGGSSEIYRKPLTYRFSLDILFSCDINHCS